MRKIRELGSLPSDAFEKYQNLSLKQVSPLGQFLLHFCFIFARFACFFCTYDSKIKSLIFKCYFSEELIALTVLRWIRTSYLRITKPER